MLVIQKSLKYMGTLPNIAQTYIDTDSHKLKQIKAVIIICQTSSQSATMKQNYQYCSSKSIFDCRGINVDTGLSAYKQFYK
jgi:hypothetical protein